MTTVGTVTATSSKDKEDWKSFEVRFDGFEKLPAEKGKSVISPAFTCFHHKWRLIIYPGGDKFPKSHDGMVAVFLEHLTKISITVQFVYAIRDKEGKRKEDYVSSSKGDEFVGSKDHDTVCWGSRDFCERSTILDSLVDGALIIDVRMRRPTTEATDNGGGKKHATSNKQSAQQSAHKSKKNTSAEDNTISSPLSRRCECKCKLKTHHQLIILFMSTYLADLVVLLNQFEAKRIGLTLRPIRYLLLWVQESPNQI